MGRKEECHIRIKKAMNLRALTQSDIVEKTNIKKSALSQYISGKITPRQNAIDELSTILNVSEPWLMGYDVPMERNIKIEKDTHLTTYEKEKLLKEIENAAREENKNIDYLIEKYNLKDFSVNIEDSTLLRMAKDFKIHFSKERYLNKTINSEIKNWFLKTLESFSDEELEQLKTMILPTVEYLKNNK